MRFYFRLQYRVIFSIVYLTLSHPVIKTYLTSWRVLACIQCMLACTHTLETWMRPFKSTYFVSVYHLGILRVASIIFSWEHQYLYYFSRLNIYTIRLCCIILDWDLNRISALLQHISCKDWLSFSDSPLFLQIYNAFACKFQESCICTLVAQERASWYISSMRHALHLVI